MSTPADQTRTFNSGAATHQERRTLTFRLGAEAYGRGVLAMQEIVRLPAITAVPPLVTMSSILNDN